MVTFIQIVLSWFVVGGFVQMLLFLAGLAGSYTRGPEYAIWVNEHPHRPKDRPMTPKTLIVLLGMWPVFLFIFLRACQAHQTPDEWVLRTAERQDQRQRDQIETAVVRIHWWSNFTTRIATEGNPLIYIRTVFYKDGSGATTHMVLGGPDSVYLPVRLSDKDRPLVAPMKPVRTLDAAKRLCDEDIEWLTACLPGNEVSREILSHQSEEIPV